MEVDSRLDSRDYDPLDHLKMLFDDPSSLASLSDLLEYTNSYNAKLDETIKNDQEHYNKFMESLQETANEEANEDALNFQFLSEQVSELLQEITNNRSITTNTEISITKMTSTIQKLDHCKKNLVLSMTVLKRLQMLLNAYNQLVDFLKVPNKKNYNVILNLFSVTIELNNHFKSYKSIDEINDLSKSIQNLKNIVTNSIFNDFELMIENNKTDKSDNENYISACKILETLGDSYKSKLISWFCSNQLKEIVSLFGNINDEAGSLENLSRRFIFFKKLLKHFEVSYRKKFPDNWQVDKELSSKFCEFNKNNIDEFLKLNNENSDAINMNLIVEGLTSTLEFENYLTNYFKSKSQYKDKKEAIDFNKSISVSFEPFLRFWLNNQKKTLDTKFLEFSLPESKDNTDNEINVFKSSAELFRIYRSILSQLIKLSNGEIIIDLMEFFNDYLYKYISMILKPLIPQNNNILAQTDIKELSHYLTKIINTSDYIIETIGQLTETLKSLIKKELLYKFDATVGKTFEITKEDYLMIINESISKLLIKIQINCCDLNFKEMINVNWRLISEVSDPSRYALNIVNSLNDTLRIVLAEINKNSYIRNLLDKLIDLIIDRFLINLTKLKPINDKISSQMLLDSSIIKHFFQKLPFLNNNSEEQNKREIKSTESHSAASTREILKENDDKNEIEKTQHFNFNISRSYLNRLNSQFLKLEELLKVLMINGKDYSDLINNYLMILNDYNFDNFIKILILKGIITSPRPIHSTEKKEFLTYKEIFGKNILELNGNNNDKNAEKLTNPFMNNLIIDTNINFNNYANSSNLSSPALSTVSSMKALSPPANTLKNFVQSSPIMAGSLSLSPNINFPFKNNANIAVNGSPIINKENFEKNLKEFVGNSENSVKNLNENFKSNFGKFFNRINE